MEINDLYDYGLKIYQNKEYFKFSIDSILLAEFVKFKKGFKILDICTGNAPIPLILASKTKSITIDALEIQNEVYELAKKSIKENNLEKIVNIYNVDAKNFINNGKYDCIVCNPPYFKNEQTSYKNLNRVKKIARHEIAITLEDIFKITKKNISENGSLYLVHRIERMLDVINFCNLYKLGIRKIVLIQTKNNKTTEFFLLEASNYKKNDLKFEVINIQNKETYQNIFKEE